ncbi:rod shape-determining protein MreC [Runella slithyformis]|uniref:Cell shape-determining protein MreC n=1 Tax=Runella slithyformis (strain ATCC 29530 / DSM 19594 / LMG 11500 / NCIMB 11436 / LSU 4) TaxID=761193 RepID=A0A7U4E4V5_RUNSL|nr:rod shape-determining protein MreC [Runella slithyformis]AEI47459.1 Rod shape-determining protein MreC [Runella slithyformis DSM 19594]
MLQLFEFIGRNRNFILFVLLEVFSFWLLVNNNNYWGVEYFNTANSLNAKALEASNTLREYTNLRQVNASLAEENRRLNELITTFQQQNPSNAPTAYKADSAFASRFKFVTIAKVIDNSTHRADNYLTIDKGTAHGVKVGMGVISSTGVVGKVKICNEKFSVITSILHSQYMISTKLLRSGEQGTAKWENNNIPSIIQLKDISRYKTIFKGDTAVTSDQNVVFPPGVQVGRVKSFRVAPDQAFFEIDLELATDFSKISYVYLVENKLLGQQQSLQESLINKRK